MLPESKFLQLSSIVFSDKEAPNIKGINHSVLFGKL